MWINLSETRELSTEILPRGFLPLLWLFHVEREVIGLDLSLALLVVLDLRTLADHLRPSSVGGPIVVNLAMRIRGYTQLVMLH
jgi:hypothetical protein